MLYEDEDFLSSLISKDSYWGNSEKEADKKIKLFAWVQNSARLAFQWEKIFIWRWAQFLSKTNASWGSVSSFLQSFSPVQAIFISSLWKSEKNASFQL